MKSRFLVSEQVKNVGLIGSILLDLASAGKIEIMDGKLTAKSVDSDLSAAHKAVLEEIHNSPKERKVKRWVSRFSQKSGRYRKMVLQDLERKGAIVMEHHKFLFIKYYRTRLTNTPVRERLIGDLRAIIFNNKPPQAEDSALLGMIEAGKIYKIVSKDRQEVKQCKKKLKALKDSDLIVQGVDRVIKEMQVAIIAAANPAMAVIVAGGS
jgi:hypothetical protein